MLATIRLRGQCNRRKSRGRKRLSYLGKTKQHVLFNNYVMKTSTAPGLALCKALPSNGIPGTQHSQVRRCQADVETTSTVSAWPLSMLEAYSLYKDRLRAAGAQPGPAGTVWAWGNSKVISTRATELTNKRNIQRFSSFCMFVDLRGPLIWSLSTFVAKHLIKKG